MDIFDIFQGWSFDEVARSIDACFWVAAMAAGAVMIEFF